MYETNLFIGLNTLVVPLLWAPTLVRKQAKSLQTLISSHSPRQVVALLCVKLTILILISDNFDKTTFCCKQLFVMKRITPFW